MPHKRISPYNRFPKLDICTALDSMRQSNPTLFCVGVKFVEEMLEAGASVARVA